MCGHVCVRASVCVRARCVGARAHTCPHHAYAHSAPPVRRCSAMRRPSTRTSAIGTPRRCPTCKGYAPLSARRAQRGGRARPVYRNSYIGIYTKIQIPIYRSPFGALNSAHVCGLWPRVPECLRARVCVCVCVCLRACVRVCVYIQTYRYICYIHIHTYTHTYYIHTYYILHTYVYAYI